MPNKISGYPTTQPAIPVNGSGGSGAAPSVPSSGPAAGSSSAAGAADSVTLTGSAQTLQRMATAIAATPVVDAAKVSTIRQAVQAGSYPVDSRRIASQMLRFERGLKSG